MSILRPSLAEAVRALGRAIVYAGDATSAGGLTVIGAIEGEVQAEEMETYNDLVLPELTGETIHERDILQGGARVTVPLIMGKQTTGSGGSDSGAAVYAKISSDGVGAGGGYSTQQPVVTTTLLMIPEAEVPASGGLAFSVGAWTPNTPPVHAVWLWRAVPEVSGMSLQHGEGGKVIREVPFLTLYDQAKPEGHKLWTRGDPNAFSITILI